MNNTDINKINDMTFRELRTELVNSKNNPVRESIIRNLMYVRYNRHMQKKQIPIKVMANSEMQKPIPTKINYVEELQSNEDDDIFDFLDQVHHQRRSHNRSAHQCAYDVPSETRLPGGSPLDQEENELRDSRGITEFDRDLANNNLMDRLNDDVHVRDARVKNKKDLILPYSNDAGDNYAPFKEVDRLRRKKDFSNVKFGRETRQ